jgi:hypothetical protein
MSFTRLLPKRRLLASANSVALLRLSYDQRHTINTSNSEAESTTTMVDPPEKKEPKWILPKSDVYFSFGPNKKYFIRCGSGWQA